MLIFLVVVVVVLKIWAFFAISTLFLETTLDFKRPMHDIPRNDFLDKYCLAPVMSGVEVAPWQEWAILSLYIEKLFIRKIFDNIFLQDKI